MSEPPKSYKKEAKKITIVASIILLVAVVVFFAFYFLTDLNVSSIFCFTFGGTVLIGLVLELVYPKNTAAARLRAVLRFFLYIYVFYMILCTTTSSSAPHPDATKEDQLLAYVPLIVYGGAALAFVFAHSMAIRLNKNFIYSKWYAVLVIVLSLAVPVPTMIASADLMVFAIPITIGLLPYGLSCLGKSFKRRPPPAKTEE